MPSSSSSSAAAAAAAAAAAKYSTESAVQLNLFNLAAFARATAGGVAGAYAGDPLMFASFNRTQARLLREKEEVRKKEGQCSALPPRAPRL